MMSFSRLVSFTRDISLEQFAENRISDSIYILTYPKITTKTYSGTHFEKRDPHVVREASDTDVPPNRIVQIGLQNVLLKFVCTLGTNIGETVKDLR